MKKIYLIFVALLLVAGGCGYGQRQTVPQGQTPAAYTQPLLVGTKKIYVEAVSTLPAMQQGLSGRDGIADEQGMLFNFGSGASVMPAFWMKGMKFNLDLVWIKNYKVIGITPNVLAPKSANDPLPTYQPPQPIDQALEVNAGWSAKNNLKIGDEIKTAN